MATGVRLLSLLLSLAACASDGQKGAVRVIDESLAGCTRSPAWKDRGSDLRAFKVEMSAKHPQGPDAPDALHVRTVVGNAGDWAFQSLPVTIARDDTYVFRFGPLPEWFDYPKKPSAVAFDHPPDFEGRIQPAGSMKLVVRNGVRLLEATFAISGSLPCTDLTIWAY
jgi:hypothetical protein